MNSSDKKNRNKIGAWIRWVLFSEGLILLWPLAGPGYRYSIRHRGSHALLARLFMEEPSYLAAVVVNFVAMNIFVACAWVAAWLVTRLRK